ncbi:unnamed protein product [Calypogeia fissa]
MGKAATFYSWMTAALGPVVMLHLRGRKIRGLELAKHGPERCGHPSFERPKGPLLWFHAVSVGEGMEALPVIKKCLQTRPHVNILMTTSTDTAFLLLQQTLPKGVICQFAPVDTPFAVERFLSFWEPQAAIFMESELWPNLILKSSRKGIRLALLNARISPKSLWRWSLSPAKELASEIVSKFSLIMPVNNKEALRYQQLGALPHQIHFGGNLKYASGAMDFPSINGPVYHELQRQLQGRRVWLAASTHHGEEEVMVSIHKKLQSTFPNLLTIIVPRHPHRGHSIKSFIKYHYNWEAPRRSQNEPLTMQTEIYIADTLGELAMFYHLVSFVFVGGSLFENLQGHNVAEPASAGCAVVTGRYVGHFQEMIAEMRRHSPLSIEQVAGESELLELVRWLFENGRSLRQRQEAALTAANSAAASVVNRVYRWLNIFVLRPTFGTNLVQSGGA